MKLSTIEVTGDVKVEKNELNGDVLTKSPKLSGNVSKVLDFKSAEWGSITGTLSNQTDLNNELTDIDTAISGLSDNQTTMQNTLRRISGISVGSSPINYPILTIANDIVSADNIKWLWIKLDDGTIDGYDIYLPNNHGMQTIRQMIINAIPTDTSQLTNGAGYTTNTGTLTAVNMNNEDVAMADGRAYLGSVVTQPEVDFITITLDYTHEYQIGTSDRGYLHIKGSLQNGRIPVAVCPLAIADDNQDTSLNDFFIVAHLETVNDKEQKAVFVYENLDDDTTYTLADGEPFGQFNYYETKLRKVKLTVDDHYNVTAEITEEIAMDTYDIDEAIGDE